MSEALVPALAYLTVGVATGMMAVVIAPEFWTAPYNKPERVALGCAVVLWPITALFGLIILLGQLAWKAAGK